MSATNTQSLQVVTALGTALSHCTQIDVEAGMQYFQSGFALTHRTQTLHSVSVFSRCTQSPHLITALSRWDQSLSTHSPEMSHLLHVLSECIHWLQSFHVYIQWNQLRCDWEEVRRYRSSTILQNYLQTLSSVPTPIALKVVSFHCRVIWTKTLLGPHSTQQGALPSPFHPPACSAPPHTQMPTGPG